MNLKLKFAILERYENQTIFARDVGLGESLVSRIVRGYKIPTVKQAEIICRKLGVAEDELFGPGK